MIRVYDAKTLQVDGMYSGLHPSECGEGRYQRIQNYRSEGGGLVARGGTVLYIAAPVSGATLVDIWPRTLNGTNYLIGAFLKSAEVRLYWSSAGSAWSEMTEVGGFSGGATGDTRFASDSGSVEMCVLKAPQGVIAGTTLPSRDVLLIVNGSGYNRLWDPAAAALSTLTVAAAINSGGLIKVTTGAAHVRKTGDTVVIANAVTSGGMVLNGSWTITFVDATNFTLDGSSFVGAYTGSGTISNDMRLTIHQPIVVPANSGSFSAVHSFHKYWQVRGQTNKTYFVGGVVNQTRFKFSNGSYDPYLTTNAVIIWDWGTAAATNDIAAVQFTGTNKQLDIGKGLNMFTEDITAAFGANMMLPHIKLELGHADAAYNNGGQTWSVLYDPQSTDGAQREYTPPVALAGPDTDPPRLMWCFPARHLSGADRKGYLLRATRLANAPVPTGNSQIAILAMAGAGSIPGAGEITLALEDHYGRAESRGYVARNDQGAPLSEFGGPITFASSQGNFIAPISTSFYYDFDMVMIDVNGGATITGGLNGQPSRFNFYLRVVGEPVSLYWYSLTAYSQVAVSGERGWARVGDGIRVHEKTSNYTDVYSVDWTSRDPGRFAPSQYHITIPRCFRCLSANNRLFVGDVLDDASQRQRSDLYYSQLDHPFRMQAVVEDEVSGGRTTLYGEQLQGLSSTAAAAQGRSFVFALTDKRFCGLGGSGPFVGSSSDAAALSVVETLFFRGTLSPRSLVVGRDGTIFFLDDTGQWLRYAGGTPIPISRRVFDDKPTTIPAARRDDVSGVAFGDRLLWAYTDALNQSTNRRIVAWNDVRLRCEFDDLPVIAAERLVVYTDPSVAGTGVHLLIARADGALYRYDVAGSDDLGADIAVRLTTGDVPSPPEAAEIIVHSVQIEADPQSNALVVARLLRAPSGSYSTTLTLTDGWVTDENEDHAIVSAPADGFGERSKAVQLDISGNMDTGTRLYTIEADVRVLSTRGAKAG